MNTPITPKKRSHAPIFWLLFGGGGSLSALFGTVLVLVTGLLVPLGLLGFGAQTLSYAHMLAFAQNFLGKAILFAFIFLFAWHAMHRLYKSLHDVGVHPSPASRLFCYGIASIISVVAAFALLKIGF